MDAQGRKVILLLARARAYGPLVTIAVDRQWKRARLNDGTHARARAARERHEIELDQAT